MGGKFFFDQNLLCAKFSGEQTQKTCHTNLYSECGLAELELELEKPKASPSGSVVFLVAVVVCLDTD